MCRERVPANPTEERWIYSLVWLPRSFLATTTRRNEQKIETSGGPVRFLGHYSAFVTDAHPEKAATNSFPE